MFVTVSKLKLILMRHIKYKTNEIPTDKRSTDENE